MNSMKLWIARDPDDVLFLYKSKPQYHSVSAIFVATDGVWINLSDYDMDDFPEVTFENSPQEIELKLIEK